MIDGPKLIIHDANVLIDLANGGILETWFALGFEAYVTDMVLNELQKGEQWTLIEDFVASDRIQIRKVDDAGAAEYYDELFSLVDRFKISPADASSNDQMTFPHPPGSGQSFGGLHRNRSR